MRIHIISKEFNDRDKAKLWMKNRYSEYPDGSIVSSCFAERPHYVTGYVTIDLDKLKPAEKKLIKIT